MATTTRIDRDTYFIRMALLVAERGTCNRLQVGAVLVRDRRVVATGYNGSPPGLPHCLDVGCDVGLEEIRFESSTKPTPPEEVQAMITQLKDEGHVKETGCQRTVHAEANTIAFAARHGLSTEGATLYTTDAPCKKCAELLGSAGISEVVFRREYRITEGVDLLRAMGIEVRQHVC